MSFKPWAEADRSSLQREIFPRSREGMRRKIQASSQKLVARSCFKLSVILPRGIHPFPSRTRKLSPAGPMVLHAPSVWERRSLPALIKASLRNQIGLFLLGTSPEFPNFVGRELPLPHL